MSDEWDAEDFEPPTPATKVAVTDKWEGEDEEEDVKDNWEDSDEEKKEKEGSGGEGTAYQRPKKKPLAERIAEKEAKRQQDYQDELKKNREPTAEEKLAEKIRMRKVQLASDLKNAEEIFGVKKGETHIESMFPETEEEFDNFRDAIKTKITEFEASKLYGGFIEKLIQDLSLGLQSEDIKRIGTSLNGLYHEKERQRKEAERKKKKKQKAIVKVERGDLDLIGGVGEYDYNDDEDFM